MILWNDIITLILWLDFLLRYFPDERNKLKKYVSNLYILFYSILELEMKRRNLDIFDINDNENNNDNENMYYSDDHEEIDDEEILNIINKHKNINNKEKFS